MDRILVVLPLYGGSLPIGRYCASAFRNLGCLVDVFEAPSFFSAFDAVRQLRVASDRYDYLKNSFLQLMGQAILAKVEQFKPDLVFCMAQAPMTRQTLTRLRKDGIPTAMWFVEDYRLLPYWRAYAPLYDVFAVIQKEPFFSELASAGVANSLYLPMAADPEIHKPLELSVVEKKRFGAQLSFMGAGYPNRKTAFRAFIQRGLKIWGTEWEGDSILKPLVQMEGKRITTEESVAIFNAAEINLNLHSSIHATPPVQKGDFVNPRTFEIAACRAFQLVDKRDLLPELFAEDELATFSSLEELKDKTAYFLAHPEERQTYAEKAYARVLQDHTYTARMRTLLNFTKERLAWQKKAPEQFWPDDLPEPMRDELTALYEAMQLPADAPFADVVTAIRGKAGELTPLETSVLFLDEWKRQYAR